MTVRIGVVSPLDIAITAVADSFRELWPEAECINLLDESLYADHDLGAPVSDVLRERMLWLFDYSIRTGAAALIFTGSVFNAAVRELSSQVRRPVITSFEGVIEDAFTAGRRLGALTSVPQSLDALAADIAAYAAEHGLDYTLDARVAEGAMEAGFGRKDMAAHDAIVAEAARDMTGCDALILGQFSMGGAVSRIEETPGRVVLTPPRSAVLKLKRMFSEDAAKPAPRGA